MARPVGSDNARLGNRDRGRVQAALSILHPICFALYPVLALLSVNVQQVRPSDAYRSGTLAIIGAAVVLLCFRLLLSDWRKAGALTSFFVVLFFSYGHVYAALKSTSIAGLLIGRRRYMVPIWGLASVVGVWLMLITRRNLRGLTRFLNLVSVASLGLTLVVLVSDLDFPDYISPAVPNQGTAATGKLSWDKSTPPPDIYYIILDAYARADILQVRYGYDNAPFIRYLRSRGFYVADESASNYLLTAPSLASSLNLDYLSGIDARLQPLSPPASFYESIKHSRVRRELEQLGYSTVAVPTGWYATEVVDATYFLTPERAPLDQLRRHGGLNAFEGILLQTSAVLILSDIESVRDNQWIAARLERPFQIQKEIILSAFDRLEEIPDIAGPKFVFVHIISPHKPHFFGPDGEARRSREAFTLAEDRSADAWEQDAPRYTDQLTYVNTRLEGAIDTILDKSERPPIIILQSDHGPGIGFDRERPEAIPLRDRMSILNAYYFPEGCDRALYAAITPINSFRILLNCYFGGSYPIREDVTYFDKLRPDSANVLMTVDEVLRQTPDGSSE